MNLREPEISDFLRHQSLTEITVGRQCTCGNSSDCCVPRQINRVCDSSQCGRGHIAIFVDELFDQAFKSGSHLPHRQHFGKHRNGLRRFRCPQCKRTYTESHRRTLDTMHISEDRAVLALQLLLEGNSIRSTERIWADLNGSYRQKT